jgi:hypothetical protein
VFYTLFEDISGSFQHAQKEVLDNALLNTERINVWVSIYVLYVKAPMHLYDSVHKYTVIRILISRLETSTNDSDTTLTYVGLKLVLLI